MKRFIIAISLFLGSVVIAQAQQTQVIAVATVGSTQNSEISSRAARAPYFLILDKHGKLLEVVSNPFHNADRGAGPKVAELLAGMNVTVVVAGAFGHKIKTAFDEQGISYYEATGVVKKIVPELLRDKKLKR